jgi:hypothetical protein
MLVYFKFLNNQKLKICRIVFYYCDIASLFYFVVCWFNNLLFQILGVAIIFC